ncbi:MAG: response regulator [Defluviitaleaceae bacterium]|nr:response regulator [Defluviitaleaceae bacterium]
MHDDISKMNERKRVLMIDDTEAYLLILNDILKDDYDTIIAKNGADGLELINMIMPDLIILDLIMPDLSGYDVLKTIKANETLKAIPVILITGKDSKEDMEKGYELGATNYIRKPFDSFTVKEVVDSII